MQKITIKSFGPIKNISITIKDIIILNGVQSSGKSTLAKSIYMFKELPNTIFNFLATDNLHMKEFEKDIVIAIRKQFVAIFGTTKHMDDFHIRYEYTKDRYIEVKKDFRSGHAFVIFSKNLKIEIKEILKKFLDFEKIKNEQNNLDFSTMQVNKITFLNEIKKQIQSVFLEERESIFIPAGRSLVSTLSGELKDIDSYNFDYLMKQFVQRVFYLKDQFSKDLPEILEDKKKLTTAIINFEKVELAQKLIYKILRGSYRYEDGEEKIKIDDEHFVKLKFASSGQQEILWILNILYLVILEQKKSFIVYEEPEAHMYPLTQYYVMQLVGLYFSLNGTQGIVTTHSPYIMAALNNLLFAKNIKNEKANKILNKNFWIDELCFCAYFIKDGKAIDMMDNETKIIDTSFIDGASEVINDDFDKLLELSSV